MRCLATFSGRPTEYVGLRQVFGFISFSVMSRLFRFLAAALFCAFSSVHGQIQLEVVFGISADGRPVQSADILMSRDDFLNGDFQKLPPDGKVKLQIKSLSEKIGYVARYPGF